MSDSQKYRRPTEAEAGNVNATIQGTTNVQSTSGTTGRVAQESTAANIEAFLDAIEDALASVGTDSLRVQQVDEPLNVSGATVPVEQQTPVGVEDAAGTQVNPATESAQGPFGTVDNALETVSTSGTSVQFNGGTSLTVPAGSAVQVSTPSGNTGTVYVGDRAVSTSDGLPLAPGTDITIPVDDVNKLHADADNGGDDVGWLVVT